MRELRITGDSLEVVLLPDAGARLHRLRAFGHDLLRTPDDPDTHLRDPFFWGAYLMAPWSNRVAAQPLTVGSATVDLPSNFADGTAIHGQVYARPWTVDADRITCRCQAGQDGWPWAYEVILRATVDDTLLGIRLGLVNRSSAPMPAGLGIHPWWRRPLQVAIDAEQAYRTNADSPAVAEAVGTVLDLRQLTEPALDLDATWTRLGSGGIRLAWPDIGVAAAMTLSGAASHVAVATPREPHATAIEVQSHAPDGLRRLLNGESGALAMLPPGEELVIDVALAVSRV